MAKQLNALGLSFRVVLFFGRNPEEELTTLDIAEKFDTPVRTVEGCLHRAVRDDLLAKASRGGGRGNPSVYCAGPVLLSMVGFAMEACAPSHGLQVAPGGQ
jgi:hypothetical protein